MCMRKKLKSASFKCIYDGTATIGGKTNMKLIIGKCTISDNVKLMYQTELSSQSGSERIFKTVYEVY